MATTGPGTIYEFRTTFRAPLSFVYDWCTDYTPADPRLEGEAYERRIVSKSARRAVYEDLHDQPDGWMWSRMTVQLRPPNRWHAEAVGSHRSWSIDYTLSELSGNRTELHFRGLRRPTPLAGKNPPKVRLERELLASWKNFAHALERDYRATERGWKTSKRRK